MANSSADPNDTDLENLIKSVTASILDNGKIDAVLELDTTNAERKVKQLGQMLNQTVNSASNAQSNNSSFQSSGSNSGRNSNQYAPAARTLANAIPGANILTSGLSGGGMAALAGATAVSAAIGAIGSRFNELASIADKLSQSAGNSTSALGQLRSTLEQVSIGKGIAATSPGVIDFAKAKADADKALTDFTVGLSGTKDQRDKAVAERLGQGLGGQAGEDWRRLKEQNQDLLQDEGIQRQAIQTRYQRSERDFNLSQRRFQVDTANQVFDLQKESGRMQFDNQIAIQKYTENEQNKLSAKSFAISQQFAAQNYQIQVGRTVQDYNLNKTYATQDLGLSKQYRNEDYKENLMKMAVSGNMNGADLLFMSMDKRKADAREQQQFDIAQGRNKTALGINLSRGAQDFSQSQSQTLANRQVELEGQEYARKYEGIQLQTQINRGAQDLAISFDRLNQSIGFQKEAFSNQASDLSYDKALDYSNYQIQTNRRNRNMGYQFADFAGNQRLTNPVGAVGQATFDPTFAAALQANASQTGQGSLIDQFNKTRQGQENSFALKTGEQLRQAIEDANNWLKGFGQTWASQQVGKVRDPRQFGDVNQNLDMNNPKFHPRGPDMSNEFDRLYQADLDGRGPSGPRTSQPPVVIQTGGNTYNLDPGLSASIQAYIDSQDKKTADEITEMIKRYYGG